MTESDRLELEEVLKRAKFRMECAKKKTGPEFAWFVLDELKFRMGSADDTGPLSGKPDDACISNSRPIRKPQWA